jgi:hypothetical protein
MTQDTEIDRLRANLENARRALLGILEEVDRLRTALQWIEHEIEKLCG